MARVSGGNEEIAGHFFSAETLADMSAIDLLARVRAAPIARRALVLPRNERAGDEKRLVEHLKARTRGGRAAGRRDRGYAQMMRDDPYEAVVPFATLERSWPGSAKVATRSRLAQTPTTADDDCAPC